MSPTADNAPDGGVHDGRVPILLDGFTYLPRFVETDEAQSLIDYFGSVRPLWEERHAGDSHRRQGQAARRLTRPVYWLGAWQFASLGYYAEPDWREDRCLRAEPYPEVMTRILERLRPRVEAHLGPDEPFAESNSALINYYGSDLSGTQPVDVARLRPHHDAEPGPVVMLSIGQPARFEFVDAHNRVELGVWLRHRSVCILSGAQFKDRLYHRVTQVRHGKEPQMSTRLPDFRLRRVSVSFRHVPPRYVHDWPDLSPAARAKIEGYVRDLAQDSPFFRAMDLEPGSG